VFKGEVRYLSAAMRRASRDLIVEAVVQNADGRLKPGMFAVARVAVGETQLPVVPATAVSESGDRPRVFVAAGGRLEERLVQLGRRDGDGVAILAGIAPGEQVVVKAAPELRDGLRVE
jgi:membrane fusion protein (multidrug efflux system)